MKGGWIPESIWLPTAKNLPVKGRTMEAACCGGMGTRKSLLIKHDVDSYNAYCFRCKDRGYKPKGDRSIAQLQRERADLAFKSDLTVTLPRDYTTEIPTKGRVWLYSGGVFPDVAARYRIGYSPSMERVILPVYQGDTLLYVQGRDITGRSDAKYISNSNIPKEEILAWSQTLTSKEPLPDVLVLTEDFLSAIVVGDVYRAAAMMGTSLSTAQVGALLSSPYRKIVVWLDNDFAGISATKTIVRSLRLVGFQCQSVVTNDDPKKQSRQTITNLIGGLRWT